MAEARVNKTVRAPADAVFAHLGNFAGIQPGGPVEAVTYEGEGVGMVRTITMNGGPVIERLDTHDPQAREFSYSILNNDSPLPFMGYKASVRVSDNGDGTSSVEWVGTFEPRDVPEADAVNIATGIYAGGIKGAQKALEK